jgi:hypothetical protein
MAGVSKVCFIQIYAVLGADLPRSRRLACMNTTGCEGTHSPFFACHSAHYYDRARTG